MRQTLLIANGCHIHHDVHILVQLIMEIQLELPVIGTDQNQGNWLYHLLQMHQQGEFF